MKITIQLVQNNREYAGTWTVLADERSILISSSSQEVEELVNKLDYDELVFETDPGHTAEYNSNKRKLNLKINKTKTVFAPLVQNLVQPALPEIEVQRNRFHM